MPNLDVVVPEEIGAVDECVIVTWLKQEGDFVNKDDTLFIIQAEKVSFDVPAPASGRVMTILAQQGEVVEIGQVVAKLEVAVSEAPSPSTPAEPMAASVSPTPSSLHASPIAKRLAREHNVDLTQVTGSGSGGRITEKDIRAFIKAQQEMPLAASAPLPARSVHASPLAKRIARKHNVDLTQVTGSGTGGRITKEDVDSFIKAQRGAQPAVAKQTSPAPDKAIPMAGIRAAVARNMHHSLQSMAQLTLHTEVDVTELVALYERLKPQLSLTYTDLVVRACALALQQHPHLNVTLDGDMIRLLPQINIGVAVAIDAGLVVPILVAADQQSLADLAQNRRRLVERARAGQLTAKEMKGGTFTVTNLGAYGIDGFTPIINPPEAAILGVGRIVEKVVVYQGKIAQRAMMVLSLTFDHRLVDGAPAAAFLQTITQLLAEPAPLEKNNASHQS